MSKYDRYNPGTEKKVDKNVVHPVWRGIGCVLIILIPVLSGISANILINNRILYPWIIIPDEIILIQFKDPLILVKGIYLLIISLILFFIIGLVTFILNRLFGMAKGPYDVKD